MLAKFSGVESERIVSKFRKRKRKFCVVFIYSIKRAREIRSFRSPSFDGLLEVNLVPRAFPLKNGKSPGDEVAWKFHVAVVQRRLRNVQKSLTHVQKYCFANLNLLLFCRSRCRRRRRCLSSLLS